MDIKKTLNKLPKEIKESPEFNVLRTLIEKEEIESTVELSNYLDTEAKKVREWLSVNRTAGTISDGRREKVRKLEFLETIRKEVLKYLE